MQLKQVWQAVGNALRFKSQDHSNLTYENLLTDMFSGIGSSWTQASYTNASKEGYAKNVVVYQCVEKIAQSVGSLSWYLTDSAEIEIENHKLLDRIKNPNPVDNQQSFIHKYVASQRLSGNVFIELIFGLRNEPREMWVLRPDQVSINGETERLPVSYTYTAGKKSRTYIVDQTTGEAATADGTAKLIHIKTFNPLSETSGMSPLSPAMRSVDMHNSIGEWNKRLLDNGGRPSGAFSYENSLTPEQIDQMNKDIKVKWNSQAKKGLPFLLANGLKYTNISLTPADMDHDTSKNSSSRDISSALGVPPLMLNIPGDSTYSNYSEARIAFYEETVLPLAKEFAHVITTRLAPMFGTGLYVCFDEDDISALEPKRQAKWDKISNADFLTINEKREALGYDPLQGGDELYVDAGRLPLGADVSTSEEDEADEAEEYTPPEVV